MTTATTRRIDAAYLNALRAKPQRIGYPGIPLPVACRLAATGKARVLGNVVEAQP